MQDQEKREANTVSIGTGLLMFALITGAGLGLIWIGDLVLGLSGPVQYMLTLTAEGCAAVAAIAYVYRHRRP